MGVYPYTTSSRLSYRLAVDAERGLDTAGPWRLVLRVVSLEEVQLILISRESLLEAGDGLLLLTDTRDRSTFGRTRLGPSRFCDDNFLAICDSCNLIMSVLHEPTCTGSASLRIEEGVGVGSTIIRSCADGRKSGVLVEGIDRNDVSIIAGTSKNASSLVDSCSDLISRTEAIVDDLVADIDSVNWTPVTTDLIDEGIDIILNVVDEVDANNDADAVVASSADEATHITPNVVGTSHAKTLTLEKA